MPRALAQALQLAAQCKQDLRISTVESLRCPRKGWLLQCPLSSRPERGCALDFDRQIYRTALVGEVPVGTDGRASTAIQGDPVLAVHSAAY